MDAQLADSRAQDAQLADSGARDAQLAGSRTPDVRMVTGRRASSLRIDGMPVRVISSRGPVGSPAAAFLLVHGIGMSHRYLRRLHDALAEVGDVHSVDLPGFGANPSPHRRLTIADHAELLAMTATAMGVREFVVIGHSMGAQFAVEAAIGNPRRIPAIVLIAPVVEPRARTATRMALRLAADTLREPPGVNAMVFTDYARCGIPWYRRQLSEMLAYPIEHRVADVSVPVLIVRGEHDPIAPAPWCRRLSARAGGAPLVTVPGAPHVVQQVQPMAVRDAIAAFTARARGLAAEE